MPAIRPPYGVKGRWTLDQLTPEDISRRTDELIASSKKVYDAVGGLSPDEISFETCIQPLIMLDTTAPIEENLLTFVQQSVEDKALRDASVESTKKLSAFDVEMSMRKDVFDNLCRFSDNFLLGPEAEAKYTHEQRRYVEKEIVEGRRNGLHLSDQEREKVMEVKKKISELETSFSSNLNEDKTFLEFSEQELEGVPHDLVKSFEKTDAGKCKVTMKYPHFFPVTRKCCVAETRRQIETAYQSICKDVNTPILEELIELRQKQAELLGYENHAAYVQELRMAKKPEIVSKFLSDLSVKLQPIWTAEREELLKLKEEECKQRNEPFSGSLDFWDIRYYTTKVEELRYSVDKEKLREYFPLARVTQGMFEIYQTLLGLHFTECFNFEAWHKDVKLFRVDDASIGDTLGYFFLDLHPREGKFTHAAIFELQPSGVGPDRKRQLAVSAMMANFAKPSEFKPSLLDHDELESYFHEFGHVMHNICSKSQLVRFRSFRVERDFIEAPSQMLENWVWEAEPLQMMSGHYQDGSAIPRPILDKLLASRKANAGVFNLRQVLLATFDQRVHSITSKTSGPVDTQSLYSKLYEEILGFPTIPGTNMPANWGHMCGYDAQYYGYLWSEVFSFDMYETRFKREGTLNPYVGMDYRRKILQPGGSKDASELLKDFLGREPNDQAFLRSKGFQTN